MKLLKPVLLIGSILLSSAVWAEGGSDRALARHAAQRDTVGTVMLQAEQAQPDQRLGQMVACK
ncbi:co-regulatory protein PtrA N-terminal domain-containing protein (plasmid) [Pseudomonas mandelii]|uniref:co-regulatory protein PtrA N-terminal domain-containing protein n=1 Tax=Pseudomonas mandelii TaxID=75612 RepID=UPI00398D45EA